MSKKVKWEFVIVEFCLFAYTRIDCIKVPSTLYLDIGNEDVKVGVEWKAERGCSAVPAIVC